MRVLSTPADLPQRAAVQPTSMRSEPMAPTNEGPFVVSEPCPVCHGQGTINDQPCAACHGTGVQRFYHGTRADLKPGDLIEPGNRSNFGKRKQATYVYLTGTLDAATWGAELALGESPGRIYLVEPTGPIMDDPDLTDKKYPGNPTKAYRSREPLRVTGELTDWQGHSPEALKAMKDNLERLRQLGVEAIDD
jgi:hypothetical protein